jgi:predicted alpha/beta-hydrolase family hydrolase
VAGNKLSNVLVERAQRPFARFLFAHGAGAPMDSSFMQEMAATLAQCGVEVVRFEFPYMSSRRTDGRRRPPDRAEKLLAHWGELIGQYADEELPLFIGGKSMGGRMATLWAAEHYVERCRGVVCFGYPFHPAGKPEKLRIQHLSNCQAPVLVIQGERDPLGSCVEVAAYDLDQSIQLQWLAAADHDLKPLRSSGHSHQDHLKAAAEMAAEFMCDASKLDARIHR